MHISQSLFTFGISLVGHAVCWTLPLCEKEGQKCFSLGSSLNDRSNRRGKEDGRRKRVTPTMRNAC